MLLAALLGHLSTICMEPLFARAASLGEAGKVACSRSPSLYHWASPLSGPPLPPEGSCSAPGRTLCTEVLAAHPVSPWALRQSDSSLGLVFPVPEIAAAWRFLWARSEVAVGERPGCVCVIPQFIETGNSGFVSAPWPMPPSVLERKGPIVQRLGPH